MKPYNKLIRFDYSRSTSYAVKVFTGKELKFFSFLNFKHSYPKEAEALLKEHPNLKHSHERRKSCQTKKYSKTKLRASKPS